MGVGGSVGGYAGSSRFLLGAVRRPVLGTDIGARFAEGRCGQRTTRQEKGEEDQLSQTLLTPSVGASPAGCSAVTCFTCEHVCKRARMGVHAVRVHAYNHITHLGYRRCELLLPPQHRGNQLLPCSACVRACVHAWNVCVCVCVYVCVCVHFVPFVCACADKGVCVRVCVLMCLSTCMRT